MPGMNRGFDWEGLAFLGIGRGSAWVCGVVILVTGFVVVLLACRGLSWSRLYDG
jgi:hypothetical protein